MVSDIGDRLKRLRKSKGLSLRALGKAAHVSHSFIADIEAGRSKPSLDTLMALAQALGVSIGDITDDISLVAESGDRHGEAEATHREGDPMADLSLEAQKFLVDEYKLPKRLAFLRKQKGMSQYDLAQALHFTREQIANYEQGIKRPDPIALQQIADFFKVSLDFLLGRESLYKIPLTDQEAKALTILRRTHPEIIEQLKRLTELSPDQSEYVIRHWREALDFVQSVGKDNWPKPEPQTAKEENENYRPGLDKLAPLDEPDLGQALVKLSEIAYAEKLTDEEFSTITKKLVAHYGAPQGGEWAAHGPKLPGQIGRKDDERD